ncbi:anti-sigma factor [Mesorhizobium sp. M1B.F.Ca.ET.045.04.1.1]|uniref:anti-sigma factor family protein n=1 Tax=Mesorhizobium sp. M1B.F.Ca.ET.045.04.1.1 TaxID=2493673 RepID=UPI000F764BAD|nr:anti-sigma factor [Mesorhizobium sp. M1B.F.Ca.ET.045.04.1.1]AZO27606.1 anti-sigma factor [Mesorhizobium sp. M1B.F.Ca.ET.045.04.1.1]
MSPREDGLPEDPQDMKLMIHALVDGELDAAAALAVERRIAADPELAAEHARILALRSAIANVPRPEISSDFLARIAAIGEVKASGEAEAAQAEAVKADPELQQGKVIEMRPRATARWFNSFDWRQMAASIVLTAFLASGATQWLMVENAPDSFAVAAANGHRRSLLAATPVDIVSSDRHTVKPWLDGRIGVSPPAPDMAKDGYALLGGRVEVIGDKPVPALVYRHHEHLITLVAAPRQYEAPVPVADDLSAGGFLLVHWTDDAFSYWAISDAERPALDDFVARFREAIIANPTAGSPG